MAEKLRKLSWEEVNQHKYPHDCWVVIQREIAGQKRGIVYNVTSWVPKHPGGDIIIDGAGGDCTIQFWSYHPLSFIDRADSMLNKYIVGEIENYKLMYDVDTPFFRTLKTRVEDKIPPCLRRSDPTLWIKTALLCTAIGITFWYGWIQGNITAIVLLGFLLSQTGLNMMHDGIHGAYSKSSFMNTLVSFSFNVVGCNFITYRRAHAFGHHAYTNHLEYDTGISSAFPVLRLHEKLPRFWFHYIQHIYVFLIYLVSITLFVLGDFDDLFTLFNYPKRRCGPSLKQWGITILGKLIFVTWFFGHFFMFPFQKALLDCVLVAVEVGFCGLIFFIVNHWTDKAVHFTNEDLISGTNDWAALQVLTSSNYAINSFFWTHLSGGLNLQIEHHLFPALSHTRLSVVTPIVRDTCKQFGINYEAQCYTSFWVALFGNFVFTKKLGNGTFLSRPVSFGKKAEKEA